MCLDMAWRLLSKCSAMALGVSACSASKVRMALRVGSAMAWNTSRLMVLSFYGRALADRCASGSYLQPFNCKYKCNRSVAQIFCRFFLRGFDVSLFLG